MIKKSAAIEYDPVDFFCEQSLSDGLANFLRGDAIRGMFSFAAERFFGGRGRRQRASCIVVHDLRINMLAGKMDGETWTRGCPGDVLSNTLMDPVPSNFAIERGHIY